MVVRSGTLSRTLQRFSLAVAAVAEAAVVVAVVAEAVAAVAEAAVVVAVVVAVVLVVSVEALGRDGAWSCGAGRHHIRCSRQQLARSFFVFVLVTGSGALGRYGCMVVRCGTLSRTAQRSASCEEATNWL